MDKVIKKLMSVLLCLVLVVGLMPVAYAASIVDINDSSVFLKQPNESDTCTLYANLMMFRRGALLNENSKWNTFTEDNYRSSWWTSGMIWKPTGEGMTGNCYSVRKSGDKFGSGDGDITLAVGDINARKDWFIAELSCHPEGIVIYFWKGNYIPHAVLLTDYDATSDVFYCADPNSKASSGRIRLDQSILYGLMSEAYSKGSETVQDFIIGHINSIWRIDSGINYPSPCDWDHSAGGKHDGAWTYKTIQKADGTYTAVCKNCGEEYVLPALDTSTAGLYEFKAASESSGDSNVNGIGTEPYKESCKSCGVEGHQVAVIGSVTNAYGNVWYKTDGNKYIYSRYLTKLTLPSLTAPTNLNGVRSGSANVQLTWTAVSGATSYEAQYSRPGISWTTLDESPTSTYSLLAKGFSWNYDYVDFRVRAVNTSGTSAWTEVRVYKERYDDPIDTSFSSIVELAKQQSGKTAADFGFTNDWCAQFVGWCARQLDITSLLGTAKNYPSDFAEYVLNHRTGKVFYFPNTYSSTPGNIRVYLENCGTKNLDTNLVESSRDSFLPQAGDLICFLWESSAGQFNWSHIGIVKDVAADRVYYIDGNHSGNTGGSDGWKNSYVNINQSISRQDKAITCYIRPYYSGTDPTPTVPDTPSNLAASTNKNTYLLGETVTFTLSADNATKYAVSVWDGGAYGRGSCVYNSGYSSSGTFKFKPSEAGTYAVRYQAENNEEQYINEDNVFSVVSPTLDVTANADGTVTVTWTASDWDGYWVIYRNTEPTFGNANKIARPSGTTTTWDDSSTEPGVTYYYMAQAHTSTGSGFVKTNVVSVVAHKRTIPISAVALSQSALSLKVGDSETLIATVSPSDATDRAMAWSSSNPSVATVSGGKVTAVAEGTATITATAGDFSASCTVTVGKKSAAPADVHLPHVNAYYQDRFGDVPENQWYTGSVAEAYELGLMKGNSDTTFNPYGNVTLGEAITMAARIHSIYTTGTEHFDQSVGEHWYDTYKDYAYENGIIDAKYYRADATQIATRAQFARIFANSLPAEALAAINTIVDNAIPDVKMSDSFAQFVYKLYRAGILTGSDANGTFNPLTYITRAEAAAIVSRMADSDNRVKFGL